MRRLCLVAVLLSAPTFCSGAGTPFPFADNKKSMLGYASWERSKPVDITKAPLVKDGSALKALVEALGPGWVTPDDGLGVIRWFFKTNRTLSVWPQECSESEIIPMRTNNGCNRPCIWWNE